MLAMIMPIKETSAWRCSRKYRRATACRATLQQIAQDLVRTNWEGLAADASLHPGSIERKEPFKLSVRHLLLPPRGPRYWLG